MKTAMQELKIWIDDQVNLGFLDKKYSERLKWYIGYYFLEKEKEQTIDFVEWAFNHRLNFQPSKKGMLIGLDMQDYSIEDLLTEYNQTYNQNK
jgi:hypothetical protein